MIGPPGIVGERGPQVRTATPALGTNYVRAERHAAHMQATLIICIPCRALTVLVSAAIVRRSGVGRRSSFASRKADYARPTLMTRSLDAHPSPRPGFFFLQIVCLLSMTTFATGHEDPSITLGQKRRDCGSHSPATHWASSGYVPSTSLHDFGRIRASGRRQCACSGACILLRSEISRRDIVQHIVLDFAT
jgi:hypothetical protein